LDGELIGSLPKVREEIADPLLTGVDDLTGGSLIDGSCDVLAEFLESFAELLPERLRRQGRLAGHWLLLSDAAN
jgi:hypothetical protein